jgi:hypothetical protein
MEERGEYYGDPVENFNRISEMCKGVNINLTPAQLAMVMIQVKNSREYVRHKKDNVVDSIAYMAIYGALKDKEDEENNAIINEFMDDSNLPCDGFCEKCKNQCQFYKEQLGTGHKFISTINKKKVNRKKK